MKDFKCNPKMASELPKFKAGGYVTRKEFKQEEAAEEKKDIAEDKKIAKKAIAQHESAQHKGEPKTEIKLRRGGRCKKEGGKVRKYKSGGWINEEPDDATAPVKKPVIKKPRPKLMEDEMPAFAPGGAVTDPIMRPGRAGLGTALNTGALGAAGPMGAPRNVPVSPQEADVLRGLEAVGSYCRGGKARK